MYFVARIYKFSLPSIVESFENIVDAVAYAEIMTRAKGNQYVVLTQPEVTIVSAS